ncbi:MAG: outer membrane beta-barrel domain-containing protein [Myxococcales bacterium]|nr:outer membrane beta-barrel domain-containing protein [Myxococcales bacterium]
MKKDLLVFSTLCALASVGPAFAQESPATPEAPPPAAVEAPVAEAAPAGADVSDSSATAAEKQLEEDLNLFWGKRREVSVVQKRLVEKDGRLELTAAFSTIPNDDFILYWPIGLRAGYHFAEAFAVEASFQYALQQPTDLTKFLETDPSIELNQAEIREKIDMFYDLALLWSPIYGKISVLGQKLTHFETYVGLGAGIFHTTTKRADNPNPQAEIKPAGSAIVGFRWLLTDHLDIRTDYRHHFYQKFGGGVSKPAEVSLGIGLLI